MSIRKSHVLDLPAQLDLIKKIGFKHLSGYKKSEILIGDSQTIELIHMNFSNEGREMIEEIEARSKTIQFVNKLEYLMNENQNFRLSENFLLAFGHLNNL